MYFPAMNQSSIHFFPPSGYRIGLKVVPYSVVAPLALEITGGITGLARSSQPV